MIFRSGPWRTSTQLLRGLLGRPPTNKEVQSLASQIVLHGDLEAITRDLIMSKEFSIQILPQLVSRWSEEYTGKKIFFLHVPKTAGTSVRLALVEGIGLPAMNLYATFIPPGPHTQFWPFWAGHAGVRKFPDTHQGFTVFRESRSRLLSMFRQAEFAAASRQRISLDENRTNIRPTSTPVPYKVWRDRRAELETWFFQDEENVSDNWQAFPDREKLRQMSQGEKRRGIAKGLERISYAAWAHRDEDLLHAVSATAGRDVTSIPRENTIDHRTPNPPLVELTARDLKELNRVADSDQLVLEIAVSQGLIPPISEAEADGLFRKTLQRLNFVLP